MADVKAMVSAALAYLRRNPDELLRAMRNAVGFRIGVPLSALRWFAGQVEGRKAPKDVQISSVPPGLRASAVVDLAGTEVRAGATVFVDRVAISAHEIRFELRLDRVELALVKPDSESPLATLLKSGALDLSKPGNLVAFMPKRPAMLVEAEDNRIVLDLKKHPKLANGDAARLLNLVTQWVTVRAIETGADHLHVAFRPLPRGFGEALSSLRLAF